LDTLQHIINKYKLNPAQRLPIEIPDMGRNQLAEVFYELNFTSGAEIGVESGAYSEILCKANPSLHLFCVDAWITYRGYRDYTRPETIATFYENAQKTLSQYNTTLIRKFSMDAVKDFKDESLDFVYIDGNHTFPFVTQDIAEWSKKVKPGGIIAGHDYHRYLKRRQIHVVDVVNAYTHAYDINPWFVTGSKEKIDGVIRDTVRSWFWVNRPLAPGTQR
jgi:hypothetical protein